MVKTAIYVGYITANATIAKGQIVKITSGQWVPGAANDDAVKGVACHSAVAGELLKVCVEGEVDVLVGAQLTLFGEVMCDANGEAIDATSTSGNVSLGTALETGAASNAGFARMSVYQNKPVAP